MKTNILSLLFSLQVFALTETVTGSGNYGGVCLGDSFSRMCVDRIKDRAEDEAQRDADFQCRMRNGHLQSYGSCNTYCNPFFIPEDFLSHYVNCRSDCRFNCEIRDP